MALEMKQWEHGTDSDDDQDEIKTSVVLRSNISNVPVAFQIDVKRKTGVCSDCLLLQVTNCQSNVIFQSFLRHGSTSRHRSFNCPSDILKTPLVTVTVFSVQTKEVNKRVWYKVKNGGKTLSKLVGGVTINYMDITLQPLGTYLDLLAADTKQVPYQVDVISISPRRYMLTDLKHKEKHTDTFIITLYQIHPPASWIMFHRGSATTYEIPFDLKPATQYKLQLFRVRTEHANDDMYIGYSHSTVTTFITHMTKYEVLELYNKAAHFLSNSPPTLTNISHFYRNKSEEYFSNIMRTDGVMHKYDKNWGGDQASTLNKQVQGLFFSAAVDPVTRLPPDVSYFGPLRLHVPTNVLLNNNINMYFSDFYCHYVNHKVQLVFTVKGSPTDDFCRQRLVLVDQTNNPFLTRVRCGFTEIVRVTMNVTVEIFYTEDVPVRAMVCRSNVFFTTTKQKGNALVMVNGIPKNKNCRICNLDCFLLAHAMIS
ncbi:phytanoyl-CoA hydroxylase-interacting protein-like [Mizuhopecten yessoensis]|uniref:phytanoyl-CoA hydroxylase-interacting protein-like n=1 Tax=Mizuhopecten yessoensis TaxID=6573 RepID=UPI000B457883|nr:phytanoyl-CoA hydroxylase-interacting protein-like [Mizuhopecten yessoensis]XP_021365852.1 phytanoyl-CoA hydroxylase-interacting protein-like [Mizuhopecten yessoensis]